MAETENYDPVRIEEEMLAFWQTNEIYSKAKKKCAKGKAFYFLDGPPYTSGGIHIGTAWNKSLKDSLLRYKRMRGFNVWDRAGYDMHGLPTENATQKKLGLKNKDDIHKLGVPKFMEECKKLCIENMKKMNLEFERLGVWMDFDGAYQSVTKEFIEGEWWLIKKAHEKGRLYQGLRTMTWCPITESALAKHELEYKTVKDMSIFMKFKIKNTSNEYLIIWTTTPWTIPFNLAVMVNPDVEYVKAQVGDEVWIVAGVLAGMFIQGVAEKKYSIIKTMHGDALEGLEYEHPLYDELKEHYDKIKAVSKKAFTVLLSEEYVDTSAGSGLVHTAPGCGPEDYEVGYRNGIPPFNTLKTNGVFPEDMGPFSGLTARTDDAKFIEYFEKKGIIAGKNIVEHDYPHDWRHHSPVIFRTTKQWFFKIEDLKDKMVEENKKIKWVPESAFNAFDSWLKNLRDNSVSKQRFWGTPLPIWMNEKDDSDYIVVGSAKELEKLAGSELKHELKDLHSPSIDHIIIKKNGKTYRRIPDVLDVWVDAGTVSWNCLNYPHDTKLFEKLFPAEFILEGKDQIRGWFNLLMVASILGHDKPSFKNVYMHGFVNDALGRKMSKSLGNVISPDEVIEKYGSDVFRYYVISSASPGLDLNYNFDDMKVKHKNLSVLWNVHKFLIDYARDVGVNPKEITVQEVTIGIEEAYILSKLNSAIKKTVHAFDEYKLNEVPGVIDELFLELSRTYMQLVREKSSVGTDEEKKIVLYTIYRVLFESIRLLAPIAPLFTEKVYQNLRAAFSLQNESVHLCDYPVCDEKRIDKGLEHAFDHVKGAIQAILNAREKSSLGVRWPLKEAVIVSKDEKVLRSVEELKDVIKTQTNIKDIDFLTSFPKIKETLKTDYSKLGPDFGADAPKVIAKLMTESPQAVLSQIEKNGKFMIKVDLAGAKKEFAIVKEHIIVERSVEKPYVESEFRHGAVYLNTLLTKELESEGFAREVMRRVQALRKKQGLNKPDVIELFIIADKEFIDFVSYHDKQIKEKVGAKSITFSTLDVSETFEAQSVEKVKGKEFKIMFRKL